MLCAWSSRDGNWDDGNWGQTGRFQFFLTGDWGTFRLSPVPGNTSSIFGCSIVDVESPTICIAVNVVVGRDDLIVEIPETRRSLGKGSEAISGHAAH